MEASVKAFTESFVEVVSVEVAVVEACEGASVKVASAEAFVHASVEVASVESFTEASVDDMEFMGTSMEAYQLKRWKLP